MAAGNMAAPNMGPATMGGAMSSGNMGAPGGLQGMAGAMSTAGGAGTMQYNQMAGQAGTNPNQASYMSNQQRMLQQQRYVPYHTMQHINSYLKLAQKPLICTRPIGCNT